MPMFKIYVLTYKHDNIMVKIKSSYVKILQSSYKVPSKFLSIVSCAVVIAGIVGHRQLRQLKAVTQKFILQRN
jgi:hypothetical protein